MMYTKRPNAKHPFACSYLLVIGTMLCLAAPNTAHAQVPTPLFGQQNALTQSINGPSSVYATDLDNDGDADVLSASYSDGKIAWYANDGTGNFGEQQIIATYAIGIRFVYATDLDNDGDADVLSASIDDDKIAWYPNDGTGNFGSQQIITIAANGAYSVYATDLDGDGDADVLSASFYDNKIAWYPNDGTGNFGSQQIITTNANAAWSVYATDLDNDGDADVLSASNGDNKIAWYPNDGTGNFGSQQIITTNANGATAVYATDLDNDGDADVLSASTGDSKIAWYPNNGTGNFGTQQIITINANGAYSVYATDLDNNGDADVLSASFLDNKVVWYPNEGIGNFGTQQIITTNADGARSVYATDLDNDGDADVLSASFTDNKIAAYTNDGAANFSEEQIIIQMQLAAPQVVCTANLDNDGFIDLVSASLYPSKLVWFKNKGDDTFNEPSLITNEISNDRLVYTADMDTDGDADIVYIADVTEDIGDVVYSILWAENDGTGNFIALHDTYYTGSLGVNFNIADLDNDGDVDLFRYFNATISYRLNNGTGNFASPQIVATAVNSPPSLNATDLDNDGYLDFIFSTNYGSAIRWYKNNGTGIFTPQSYIDTDLDFVGSIYTADLNNDGNTDILWTGNNKVAWIPNNGDNTFGNSQIISNQADIAQRILAADVDNDGDIDVLSASRYSIDDPLTTANKIVWFSNNDNGTFAPEEVITTNIDYIQSIATADLDNDGDLDLASASYGDNKVAWYENLLSYLPPPATTPPTASFNTYPTTTDTLSICQGQTVYFNNTSQNATNYNWTFGDGTQSNDSNPAHTFNTSGNYEVELVAYKVESDNPCVLAVNDTFTVYYNSTTINVANNDFTCNQAYSIAIVSQPMYGSVSVTGTNIVYNLYGYPIPYTVSFYYQLITPQGASTALVVITTAPCLVLEDDVATTTMNTPVQVNIGCNDFVCNSFAAVQVYNIAPQHGAIELESTFTTGGCLGYSITYTPDSSFVGTDCFTYTASDASTEPATATICITVTDSSGAANGKLNLSTSINNTTTPKQAKRIPNPPSANNIMFNGGNANGKLNLSNPQTPTASTQLPTLPNTTTPKQAKRIPNNQDEISTKNPLSQRGQGDLTDTARLIVVVLPGTAPNLSCVGSVCAGDEVQYSTDANCTNYNWTITGAQIVTGQGTPNINVIWGSGPAGTIELLVDNCTPDVCALPLSVPIGIMPNTATITGDSIICANQTAIYTLPYINGAEYTWSISPASAGSITAGQYTPTVTINWLAQNATLHATINHHLANCSGTATLGISLRPRLALTPDVPLICVGNALQIGTSPNTACNWELSSGTITNGQGSSSIEAIWQDAGTQTITATAINPTQVCQPTETTTITTKNIAPTPTNIIGASQICPQQIYTYTAVPSIAGTQLTWTVQGGTLISGQNTNTIQVQWAAAEPYSLAVYRQYTATPSCPSNTFNLTINALPTDAFSITGSNNVCAGTTSNYTATSTLTNPTYDWVITPATAGTIVSGQGTANISVIWSTNPQSANITAAYCTQNQSFDVVINALPQVSITQNSTLCVGSSTTLSFTPAYNIHTWTNSSGSTISNNATATVTQSDTYTLTIADTNGCTATSIIAVDTLPRPTALIYTAGKSTFCIQNPGETSTFEAAVGQYFTYQWYNNGNPIAGATNPTYTHVSNTDIDTYNYYVVVSHAQTGCSAQSNDMSIFQFDCTPDTTGGGGTGPGCPDCPPPPTCTLVAGSSANFSIVADNNDCNTFTFVNTSTGSPINNIWILNNNTQFNTTDLTYTYNQIGKYRIYLLTGFTNLTPQPNECYLVAIDSVRVPIKADFNATQNTCAGDTVTFTDYSIHVVSTTLTNWTWDFGDGTTATNIQNPTHVYANSGIYTATLSVTNDTCTSTISQNVAVQGIPIVSFSAASIGCATNAVSFTPNQSNLATFEWAFGNDDSTTLSNPSYAYSTNGTYNVSLTATDVYGCANATYTQAIDILPAPAIENITATDTLLCFGETSTLTAPANATAYLWSNGSTNPQITVSQSGNYSVRVTLDNGCYYNTPAQVVTVYNPPPAQANIYSATGTYCPNDTVMATVTPGYTYLWNNGNTTSSFITEPNQFYFVTVTDTTTGCSAVSEPILGVSYDNPETPQIAPGNLVFCEGETHLLTTNGNTNYNYTWSNNQSGNTIEVFSSGTYVVTVTNQQHCTATNSVQVQVTPRPNASAFPTGCYDICSGDTISVPLPTNATATWYLNGTQIGAPAVSGNNLIPTQSGSYSVLLNTPFGCTDASDTLTLEVLNNCFEPPLPVTLLSFDGTVKENGNLLRWISATEINCHHYTLYATTNANANNANSFIAITQLSGKGNTNTTHTYTFMHPTNEPITYYRLTQTDFDGTETIVGNVVLMRNKAGTDIAINISPNPTHSDFTLTLFGNTLPAAVNVFVVDVAGRIVQQNNYNTAQNITINRRNLPNGMYFVRVQDANNGQIIGVNKVVLD